MNNSPDRLTRDLVALGLERKARKVQDLNAYIQEAYRTTDTDTRVEDGAERPTTTRETESTMTRDRCPGSA